MVTIPDQTDVLVIGGGASGIPAAIGAARAGARVVLVEEDPTPGGAAVDQFVSMPGGGPRSGVVAEMLQRLEHRYALTPRPVDRWWDFWYLPSDMMRVGVEMLTAEANLTLLCPARVNRLTTTEADGRTRVNGALVPDMTGRERAIRAHVVIEATGSGRLAEDVGCEARYGEDAKRDFNESIAPDERSDLVQQCTWMYISQRIGRLAGDDDWFPKAMEPGHGGSKSARRQKCDEPQAGMYLHWGCRVECRDTRDPIALAASQREGLAQMKPALDELRQRGWSVHLAPKLGVRESRRILGEHVITADDLIEGRVPDDSVYCTMRGFDLWRKGKDQMSAYPPVKPYGIPYRALVPRGVDGLFVVGKAMSGTHLALSAYRTQPLLGQIGQAAGVAAAMCAEGGMQPRSVVFDDLSPMLVQPPQNLVIRADRNWVDYQAVFSPRDYEKQG